jgi:hypothetical protein
LLFRFASIAILLLPHSGRRLGLERFDRHSLYGRPCFNKTTNRTTADTDAKDVQGFATPLGETCDGTQMSEPLSERRIPQALKRNVKSGATTSSESKAKSRTIKDSGYVRWTFIFYLFARGSWIVVQSIYFNWR